MGTSSFSQSQLDFFEKNGYLQLSGVLSRDELQRIRNSLDEAMAPHLAAQHSCEQMMRGDKYFVMRNNLWRVHEGVKRFVFNSRLAEIARQLTRSQRVRLWHDGALIKVSGGRKPAPWHRDFPYWSMNEPKAVSCWIPLDDVDETNGCLQFIPGSHLWNWISPIDPIGLFQAVKTMPITSSCTTAPVIMRLAAGSCTFHHCLLFHYSSPNTSEIPRRAIKTVYMPEGVTYRFNPHCTAELSGFQAGQALVGDRFPVLAG